MKVVWTVGIPGIAVTGVVGLCEQQCLAISRKWRDLAETHSHIVAYSSMGLPTSSVARSHLTGLPAGASASNTLDESLICSFAQLKSC